MKLELDCRQVARLISDDLEQPLDPAQRARVRLHFVLCSACRNVEEQMAFLRHAMRRLDRHDPPAS